MNKMVKPKSPAELLQPAQPLTLAFRPWELLAMGVAAAGVAFVIRDGRAHRWEGRLLVGVYVAMAIAFLFVGERGGG